MILEGPVPAVEEPGGWGRNRGVKGGGQRWKEEDVGGRVPSAAQF